MVGSQDAVAFLLPPGPCGQGACGLHMTHSCLASSLAAVSPCQGGGNVPVPVLSWATGGQAACGVPPAASLGATEGGSRQWDSFFPTFRGGKAGMPVWAARAPSETGGESLSLTPAASGGSWPSLVWVCSLVAFLPVGLLGQTLSPSSCTAPMTGSGMASSHLNALQRPYLQVRSPSEVLGACESWGTLTTGSTPHSASWPRFSCSSSSQDASCSGTTVCSSLLHTPFRVLPPFFPRHLRALPLWVHLPLGLEGETLLFPILRG